MRWWCRYSQRGSRGYLHCSSFFFPVFLSPEKEKRIGDDAVGKSLSPKHPTANNRFTTHVTEAHTMGPDEKLNFFEKYRNTLAITEKV